MFFDKLGLVQDVEVSLKIVPDAQLRFFRPQPIPYALRTRVKEELDQWSKMEYWSLMITPTRQLLFCQWSSEMAQFVFAVTSGLPSAKLHNETCTLFLN